ncbi:hypothetical protein MUK42_30582 [Musa troglodytarum]|uniref:Uncharacterized protein n=1 Tax=Musa troglodytarum TaxID=320322 RepID=A0A9E7G7D8_9LILI|nr:hypothetical protein MUK42_30582 [Musa troglodytarum]
MASLVVLASGWASLRMMRHRAKRPGMEKCSLPGNTNHNLFKDAFPCPGPEKEPFKCTAHLSSAPARD